MGLRMNRRNALTLFALTPLVGAVACSSFTKQEVAARREPIALGAWAAGGPWNGENLERYMALTDSKPALHTWYQDWVHGGFDPMPAENIRFRDATPVLTWMPHDYTLEGKPQPDFTLEAITSGKHDSYIRTFANNVAGWGKPLLIRFAHEMNDTHYSWAVGANGNTPEQYVPMWRHVRDIFNEVGVENVRWVWCPNITYNGAVDFTPLYPGHDAVDILALDVYNFGAAQSWSRWRSFSVLFDQSYHKITDLSDNKPLMIGEMGSVEQGGDKAEWIRRAFLRDLPEKYPRVRAAVWFNEDRSPREGDWRVDTSEKSLAAFREVVESPLYTGQFP